MGLIRINYFYFKYLSMWCKFSEVQEKQFLIKCSVKYVVRLSTYNITLFADMGVNNVF
jgi:hypothetical protein